jgi:hypothetical protein
LLVIEKDHSKELFEKYKSAKKDSAEIKFNLEPIGEV